MFDGKLTQARKTSDASPSQRPSRPPARTAEALHGLSPRVPWNFSGLPVRPPSSGEAKLPIGHINDPLEHEADRIADHVMRTPESSGVHTASAPKLQLKQSTSTPAGSGVAPKIVHDVLRSSGQPLDSASRSFMEPRLRHDLSRVRIHRDSQAALSAKAVGARAYTVGQNIVFGAGEYRPETSMGRHLLAHELAHTLQQSDSTSLQRAPADAPPAAAPAASDPSSAHADREIAEFDMNNDRKNAWKLNPLTKSIQTELSADKNARVYIYGVAPSDSKEDDPRQAAADRATTVKNGLMQWIGPGKFTEDRFVIGVSTGKIADPQIQVWIGYAPNILSDPGGGASGGTAKPDPSSGSGGGKVTDLGMRDDSHSTTPPGQRDMGVDPAAGGGGGSSDDDAASSIGGQWTIHLNKPGKVERTVQIALQKGVFYYQFAVNLDTKDVQALVGVQLQKDSEEKMAKILGISFKAKASAFLQILGGITRSNGDLSGSVTFQIQAGGQVQVTFKSITVALQLAPSITYQAGQPIALDFNVAPQGGAEKLPRGDYPPFLGIPILVGTF